MKTVFFIILIFFTKHSFAKKQDSLIQKQKGWYVSTAVMRTFLMPPLLTWNGSNPIIYTVHPFTASVGYRLGSKVRAQVGLSYLPMKLDKKLIGAEVFHYPYDYVADDRARFLNIDLQLKGYVLNPRYYLQPYLSTGIIARNYWLQQNHILYKRNTKEEVDRINQKYNGTTFHYTINPGLQLRVSRSFEVFTELNIRNPIGNLSYTKVWRNDIANFNGITGGLTYHFADRK